MPLFQLLCQVARTVGGAIAVAIHQAVIPRRYRLLIQSGFGYSLEG
ncbi:MAG: hypothetical protein RMY63_34645 [Nostoc sp. ChiQUE01b]|nr:hypothetical protein [Nostoc sp. ChiQUE01b]